MKIYAVMKPDPWHEREGFYSNNIIALTVSEEKAEAILDEYEGKHIDAWIDVFEDGETNHLGGSIKNYMTYIMEDFPKVKESVDRLEDSLRRLAEACKDGDFIAKQ